MTTYKRVKASTIYTADLIKLPRSSKFMVVTNIPFEAKGEDEEARIHIEARDLNSGVKKMYHVAPLSEIRLFGVFKSCKF